MLSIHTVATSFIPTPKRNETKEASPTFMALLTSVLSWSSSPSTAPNRGHRIIPTGGKKKNPANIPTVEPITPYCEPPNLLVKYGGKIKSTTETTTETTAHTTSTRGVSVE